MNNEQKLNESNSFSKLSLILPLPLPTHCPEKRKKEKHVSCSLNPLLPCILLLCPALSSLHYILASITLVLE